LLPTFIVAEIVSAMSVPYLSCRYLWSLRALEPCAWMAAAQRTSTPLRYMSNKWHPSKSWKVLNSKRGNKTFYKGRGAASEGVHTSKGKFVLLPSRRPRYIVPNMDLCQVSAQSRNQRAARTSHRVKQCNGLRVCAFEWTRLPLQAHPNEDFACS
jgi:hypothetical protein